MKTLILRLLRDKKMPIIIFSLAGLGFLWLYIAIFPSIQAQSQVYAETLKIFPDSFKKAFGIENMLFINLESYIAIEHFSAIWPLMLIIFLVSFAGSSIAGEIEQGTMGLLLSLPTSRIKILGSRYLLGIFGLVIFIILSILTAIPLAKFYNIPFESRNYFTVSLLAFLFGVAIFCLTMLFSTIFSEKGKVYSIISSTLIIMYVLKIVSSLYDKLDKLKYLSFFYYFNATDALVHNQIGMAAVAVFLATSFISTTLAFILFKKRDVAV